VPPVLNLESNVRYIKLHTIINLIALSSWVIAMSVSTHGLSHPWLKEILLYFKVESSQYHPTLVLPRRSGNIPICVLLNFRITPIVPDFKLTYFVHLDHSTLHCTFYNTFLGHVDEQFNFITFKKRKNFTLCIQPCELVS
jgi:hypothetical protein